MSDNRRAPISNTRGSGNGGQRNQGNNQNRNRNHNKGGKGGGGNRNNRNGGRRLDPDREVKRTRKKEKPLTLWQKFLSVIGLYKPASTSGSPKRNASPQSGGGGGQKGGGQKPQQTQRKRAPRKNAPSDPNKVSGNRLYVGNLSYETTEYELEELFKGVGSVRSIEVVYNRRTHKSKGYAFIEMQNIDEAKRAVEVLHDQPFMGRNMIVNGAKSKGAYDTDGNAPDEKLPSSLDKETSRHRPNPAEETVTPLVAPEK